MDILKLHDWYKTPTGHMVRRTLQAYLNEFWSDIRGKRILLLGYGVPYAHLWVKEAQVFSQTMPSMGSMRWPENSQNRSVLARGSALPFSDNFFDLILCIHGLEFMENDCTTLEECWRVLSNEGRLLSVVPNRSGAWARREISPLSRGRPYSASQLAKVLQLANFTPTQSCFGLFSPPSNRPWVHKNSTVFEKAGHRWWAPLGGVVITEAKKDIHRGTVIRVNTTSRKRLLPRQLAPATLRRVK